MGGYCLSKEGRISYQVNVFFIIVMLSSQVSLANYIGLPIQVATSLVIEENKIESYLDRTTKTTSMPTRPTSSTTASPMRPTSSTTTPIISLTTATRSDFGTQLLIVNSLSHNKDKHFSEIVNDVLASQSAPLDLMTSPREMQEDLNRKDDFSEQNNYLSKISSKPYIFKNKYLSLQEQQQQQEQQHQEYEQQQLQEQYEQQQQQQQKQHQDSTQVPTQVLYKTTYMPFKPTGSPLKASTDFHYDQPVSSVNKWNYLEENGTSELSEAAQRPYKPIGSGTWLSTTDTLTTGKPVQAFGSGYKPIYAEIRPTVKTTAEVSSGPRPTPLDILAHNSGHGDSHYYFPELISTSDHTHFHGGSNLLHNYEENYPASKPVKPAVLGSLPAYAEISSTSKTTLVQGSAPWPIKSIQQTKTTKPDKSDSEKYSSVETMPFETKLIFSQESQDTLPASDQPPGLPQYDPASVTQVPVEENEPSSLVTPVSYKPTFKPFVPETNETQFVVDNDFLLEEVSEEDEGVTVQPYSVSEENDVAETLPTTATTLAEKFDFVQVLFSKTSLETLL